VSMKKWRVAPAGAGGAVADFIVVGRPIYQSADPREICERILGQI